MKFFIQPILILLFVNISYGQPNDPVDFVNPMIGTGKSGQRTVWESNGATFPGVLLPFGMVQITPDHYQYADTVIRSFSFLNHNSGWFSGGQFQLMAGLGKTDSTLPSRPAAFSHLTEKATPCFFSVLLDKDTIRAEYTATQRTAFVNFRFPASDAAHIFLSDISEIKWIDPASLSGKCAGYYFIVHFSKPFQSCMAAGNNRLVRLSDTSLKTNAALIDFVTAKDETIGIRFGFSLSSDAGAEKNLQLENPAWDFQQLCAQNRKVWNDALGQITVKGNSLTQKRIFYTALYHSFFMPALVSDAGEKNIQYTPIYPWDTYRSEHPLLTILHPEKESDMIASVMKAYDQTGWLPTGNMSGNHNVELILDAYTKGIKTMNLDKTLEAMRKSLLQPPYARREMIDFVRFGYVPSDVSNSVTHTLEFAYNDWALAEFIRVTGRQNEFGNDYELLLQRAHNYVNLYHAATGFMEARSQTGEWSPGGYSEGTAWTYSWFVPHDVKGVINLMGGEKKFNEHLNTCFEMGHYVHDNEPPLHYAYLFDFSGEPWKTQQWAGKIVEESYTDSPGGLPGNDDLGALSSWYVLSAMGFYPVTPGRPIYEIGSPVFELMRIHLHNGKDFTIRANHVSKKNKFIQSARMDGWILDKPWFTHDDILKGRTLVFEMGPRPNKNWGSELKNAPTSITKGSPHFSFGQIVLSAQELKPDQPANISILVRNNGNATGTFELNLFDDGQKIDTYHQTISAGGMQSVSLPFKLYQSGSHLIGINKIEPVRVRVLNKKSVITYSALEPPQSFFIVDGDSCIFFQKVKNTGGTKDVADIRFYVNRKLVRDDSVFLAPGEEKRVSFLFSGYPAGNYQIGVNNSQTVRQRVLVKQGIGMLDTALLVKCKAALVLDFDQGAVRLVKDQSGLANDAQVKGEVKWVEGLFGKAIQTNAANGSYLELPRTESLERLGHSKELTMMCWIFPMEEQNFADIVSKGDWSVLQVKASNTFINFYTGGWEGHEATSPAPPNWNRHWHHIAGVFDGTYLTLYIDGIKTSTKKAERRNPKGETGSTDYSDAPWNIGRNAQVPGKVFNGSIDDVILFEKALTEEQIISFMLHEHP